MAKISHTKIKQPSFGEKRPKLTYNIILLLILIKKKDKGNIQINTDVSETNS
jgi:hypothetical protein